MNLRYATTPTAITGTAVFQMTTMELLSERNFAPPRLMAVKTIMRMTATTRPGPFSRPALGPTLLIMLKCWLTHPTLLAYVMAASTSMGAMKTACSQDAQPAVNPAIGPCE